MSTNEFPIHGAIRGLEPNACGDGYMYNGSIRLLGVWHYLILIRMKEGDLVEPPEDAHPWTKEIFEHAQQIVDGAYETVKVPGLEGRYALFVLPFGA